MNDWDRDIRGAPDDCLSGVESLLSVHVALKMTFTLPEPITLAQWKMDNTYMEFTLLDLNDQPITPGGNRSFLPRGFQLLDDNRTVQLVVRISCETVRQADRIRVNINDSKDRCGHLILPKQSFTVDFYDPLE